MVPFYRIEFCFNGFQVLRHPWIVDKAQLSDGALKREDADTVKVIITVIHRYSPLSYFPLDGAVCNFFQTSACIGV